MKKQLTLLALVLLSVTAMAQQEWVPKDSIIYLKIDSARKWIYYDTNRATIVSSYGDGINPIAFDSVGYKTEIDTILNVNSAFETTLHGYVRAFHTDFLVGVTVSKYKFCCGGTVSINDDDCTTVEQYYDDKGRKRSLFCYWYSPYCSNGSIYVPVPCTITNIHKKRRK